MKPGWERKRVESRLVILGIDKLLAWLCNYDITKLDAVRKARYLESVRMVHIIKTKNGK